MDSDHDKGSDEDDPACGGSADDEDGDGDVEDLKEYLTKFMRPALSHSLQTSWVIHGLHQSVGFGGACRRRPDWVMVIPRSKRQYAVNDQLGAPQCRPHLS